MKMRKGFSLLLALVLAVVLLCVQIPMAEATVVPSGNAPMYGREALSQLGNAQALLYAYDQLAAGIEVGQAEISVYNGKDPISLDEITVVLDAYGRDYTYHFWLGNSYSISYNSNTILKIIPDYAMSGVELEQAKAAFNAAADKLLSGIRSGMSDYEKELYIHDQLAKQVTYISTPNAHNAYGALVEGQAVCEGYAEAFQYLLQRVGIQSFMIEGASAPPSGGLPIPHAWNAVKINGKFYQVDVTWDDQGSEIYHCYFNITENMMLEDHSISAAGYALPVCNSTDAFYFNVSDANLDSYTVEKVGSLLRIHRGKAHVYIPGDVNTFLNWFVENIMEIAIEAGVTDAFTCRYSVLGREVVLEIPELQVDEPEHTHSYTPVVTGPTCTEEGYTTYSCACGDSYIDDIKAALGHKKVLDKAVDATCTANGLTKGSHCFICEAILVKQEIVPALGHEKKTVSGYAPTCTQPGKTDGASCVRCGVVLTEQSEIPALGHETVVDAAIAPTCTMAGKTEGSHCGRCGEVLTAQEAVPALGHAEQIIPGLEPTCTSTGLTEGGKCANCGEILSAQEVIPATGHTEVIDAAVAATCKNTGLTEGRHCSVCGTVLAAQTVVEKLPHTEQIIPGTAPTCTSTGLTDGMKCSVCGEILTAQTVVPASGHTENVIPGAVPTCTATGLTEGSKCSVCGTTLKAQVMIPALGHTAEVLPGYGASCTEPGLTDGEKCSVCGAITKEQTAIPATGHNWTDGACGNCGKICEHSYDENGSCTICGSGCAHEYETVVTAPTCTAQGYTSYKCTLCGSSYNGGYVDALGHSWRDATCTTPKTCSVCGTTEGEPNGHTYETVVTAPTCTAQGYTTHTCHCGDSYTDTYTEALGHVPGTPVEENRKEPACTAEGSYDTVVYCTACGTELSREKSIIPAKGHSNKAVVTAPTCTEQGCTTHTCTVCGEVTVDSYTPATGHSYGAWSVITDATCTAEGEQRRSCENCGQAESEMIEPLGHDWDGYLCTRCGESRNPYKVELALADSEDIDSVFVDGREYPVTHTAGGIRVELVDETATNLVVYTYNVPNTADKHTRYPTGMRVWLLSYEDDAYTATYIPEFDNLLQYSGSSIRITGKKGIRMITSIEKSTRKALINGDLAGFTLVEYGTAIAWAADVDANDPLVLGAEYTKSNYAYKRGEADPIFKDTGSLIQYTNVLVGFSEEQCVSDLVMRPYIVLENGDGEEITLYGGQVERSIGYIAYQNRDAFEPGTAAYDYVWNIIHSVYGDGFEG